MPRLLVLVEGETEEDFVKEVIRVHLVSRGYDSVSARLFGNARLRSRRGGIRPWQSARQDILRHLKQDSGCVVTSMVDYFGLPHSGERAWPGRADAAVVATTAMKASIVATALADDIASAMSWSSSKRMRFVPFVVMHEFEGLLFSDCQGLAGAIGRPGLSARLQAIRDEFQTPEDINDSAATAPSKRLQALVPGYQKRLSGVQAAIAIGLPNIRAACPQFSGWIAALEQIVPSAR